jgi:hypothetical protein
MTCKPSASFSTGRGLFIVPGLGMLKADREKGGIAMAAGSGSRNTPVVLEARQSLRKFRDEVANELNIDTSKITGGYWGYMTTRDTGAVGGHMVKRMIEAAERSLIEQSAANISAGFNTGLQSK